MASIRCTDKSKKLFDDHLKKMKFIAKKQGQPIPTQESLFTEMMEEFLLKTKVIKVK